MHMHQQNHWNRVRFYWYQSYHWHQWTISLTNRIRLCLLDMCDNSFCTFFWVSSFYLSVNIVLYQFTVTCIENWSARSLGQWIIESKVYLLSMLERKKKGSRLQLCFWVVNEVPERNDWICESRYMSSSKCLITCILRDFICP